MIWLILDALLAIIIVICLILGIKNGFLSMLLRIVSFFISVALAGFVSGKAAPIVYERFVKERLVGFVAKNLGEITSAEGAKAALGSGGFKALFGISETGIKDLLDKIIYMAKIDSAEVARLVVDEVLSKTAILFIRIAVFIVVFIIVIIITALLIKLVKEVNEIPVIGPLNRVFGALLGIVEGTLLAMVLCMAIGFVLSLVSKGGNQILTEACRETIIFNYLYNYNPILWILSNL